MIGFAGGGNKGGAPAAGRICIYQALLSEVHSTSRKAFCWIITRCMCSSYKCVSKEAAASRTPIKRICSFDISKFLSLPTQVVGGPGRIGQGVLLRHLLRLLQVGLLRRVGRFRAHVRDHELPEFLQL